MAAHSASVISRSYEARMSGWQEDWWSVGWIFFFFQAEDGIRDLVRSRGLGDVYKRQTQSMLHPGIEFSLKIRHLGGTIKGFVVAKECHDGCLLYTSDAADERSSVDLGGRRIIKKKKCR